MSLAIARKPVHEPVHKPAPNIGWGSKFSAFLIGTAATAGAMTYAFSSPITGGIANAAGNAAVNTAAKVAEATGAITGLKIFGTGSAQLGAAYTGNRITVYAQNTYDELGCTSMFGSPFCAVTVVGGVAGGLVVCFAAWNLYKLAKYCMPKDA